MFLRSEAMLSAPITTYRRITGDRKRFPRNAARTNLTEKYKHVKHYFL